MSTPLSLRRLLALALLALWLFAPTAAQAQWQRCAGQDEVCRFDGPALVRYGAEGRYAYRVARNRVVCDQYEFGDPAYGIAKDCAFNYDLSQRETDSPTDPDGWAYCSAEGGTCRFSGFARVRYGADNRYVYRNANDGIRCAVEVFGDPAYGVNKTCEYQTRGGNDGGNPGRGWEYCASEGGVCNFSGPGEVRYGVNGKFVVRRAINGMPCSVSAFREDPSYGQNKQCFVRVSPR